MEEVKINIDERFEIAARDTDSRLAEQAEYHKAIQTRITKMENGRLNVPYVLLGCGGTQEQH